MVKASKQITKQIDLLFFVLLFGAGLWITLIDNLPALWLGILALLPGSIYLLVRAPKNSSKILAGSILMGGLAGFIFDFIATYNGSWYIPHLVFPGRILGVLPWDDVVGWIIMTLAILSFYDHFLNNHTGGGKIPRRIRWLITALISLTAVIIVAAITTQSWLTIPYFYAVAGCLALVFPIIILEKQPLLLSNFLKLAAVFLFIWFAIEIVAVLTGGWTYPGQYIGHVIFGGVSFPIEELLFWMFGYATTVAAYYEYFFDDLR